MSEYDSAEVRCIRGRLHAISAELDELSVAAREQLPFMPGNFDGDTNDRVPKSPFTHATSRSVYGEFAAACHYLWVVRARLRMAEQKMRFADDEDPRLPHLRRLKRHE